MVNFVVGDSGSDAFHDNIETNNTICDVSKDSPCYTCTSTISRSILNWTGSVGEGVVNDLFRRKEFYVTDWSDGVHSKLFSASIFLYFACLLPSIAFGTLNDSDTNGFFSVKKTIIAQAVGGVLFSLFSTQPLIVLLSTAPLAISIKLVYQISVTENIPFAGFYAWVGIFNAVFLMIFSFFNIPRVFLRHSSPFLCETFAVFISVALAFDAIKALVDTFLPDYKDGKRDHPLLWLILMYGTVNLGLFLSNFRETKLFNRRICAAVSDFALPIAVVIVSFFGCYVFQEIRLKGFNTETSSVISFPNLLIGTRGIFISIPLGFAISILMFIDQSISAALVSTSENQLKKGIYYHADIVLLALINFILSVLGLPWIHGAIPHTPMHAKAIAVTEETSERRILLAVESRLAVFMAHVCIGISYFMVPVPLKYIPSPVLYGIFIYLAVTALPGNNFYSRTLLIVRDFSLILVCGGEETAVEAEAGAEAEAAAGSMGESSMNPCPPKRVLYQYTLFQFACLSLLCLSGLYPQPYLNASFPLILGLLMPLRELLVVPFFGPYMTYLDPTD